MQKKMESAFYGAEYQPQIKQNLKKLKLKFLVFNLALGAFAINSFKLIKFQH